MSEEKMMRLSQVARKLNVGRNTMVDFLSTKGHSVDSSPNAKINGEQYDLLAREFAASASEKEEASHLIIGTKHVEDFVVKTPPPPPVQPKKEEVVEAPKPPKEEPKPEPPVQPKVEVPKPKEETPVVEEEKVVAKKVEEAPKKPQEEAKSEKPGLKILGKIDLDKNKKKRRT